MKDWLTAVFIVLGQVLAFYLGITHSELRWLKRGQANAKWVEMHLQNIEGLQDHENYMLMKAYLIGRMDGGWASWKGLDDPRLASYEMFKPEKL